MVGSSCGEAVRAQRDRFWVVTTESGLLVGIYAKIRMSEKASVFPAGYITQILNCRSHGSPVRLIEQCDQHGSTICCYHGPLVNPISDLSRKLSFAAHGKNDEICLAS